MSRQIFIDTDGQIDSLWGLLLAKRYLEVTGISVCIGKNAEIFSFSKKYLLICEKIGNINVYW